MPTVAFTPQLARHTATPSGRFDGATVGELLEACFAEAPALRGYVVDDQGRVRKHIAVFVDGKLLRANVRATPVGPDAEVFVMQALSGG